MLVGFVSVYVMSFVNNFVTFADVSQTFTWVGRHYRSKPGRSTVLCCQTRKPGHSLRLGTRLGRNLRSTFLGSTRNAEVETLGSHKSTPTAFVGIAHIPKHATRYFRG